MATGETVKKESSTLDVNELLTMLVEALNQMNLKFDLMIELNGRILKTQEELLQKITNPRAHGYRGEAIKLEPDAMALFSLPRSLRRTVLVLYKLKEATAEDLARETKRLRAVESASANQLVRMGYLKKKREGRKVHFYID